MVNLFLKKIKIKSTKEIEKSKQCIIKEI